MKRIMMIIAVLMLSTIPALAYDDQETTDISLMVIIFFVLGVIPIVSQLILNLMHLCSILKGMFAKIMRGSSPKEGTGVL